jgi:hypothetical protein
MTNKINMIDKKLREIMSSYNKPNGTTIDDLREFVIEQILDAKTEVVRDVFNVSLNDFFQKRQGVVINE